MTKTLISIVGPTAVGKTQSAIDLANLYSSQIISADSRQCYREMTIGTAKPSKQEMEQVKHHFIDSHSIHDFLSAGDYERLALEKITELHQSLNPVIMVGGSGLYVDAVINGLAGIPKIDPGIRKALGKRLEADGLEGLYEYLKQVDGEYAAIVDKNNPQRVIRGIEVYEGTGKTYSSWRDISSEKRDFKVISIGLERDREVLYQRINDRMDEMIENGLFEEAHMLFDLRNLNPLQTVGYKEIFDYQLGKYDYEECIRLLKRNSRRYAKRQFTWFKKNGTTQWFNPDNSAGIMDFVGEQLA